jgi:hypothetical protein
VSTDAEHSGLTTAVADALPDDVSQSVLKAADSDSDKLGAAETPLAGSSEEAAPAEAAAAPEEAAGEQAA